MRTDAPVKTIDQLRQGNDPPRCSATGVGSTGYDIPRLLEDSLGMKFKIISGYPGGADQDLAMERNEVNCRAITIDGFFAREPFISWLKKGFVHVLLHTEKQRHAKIPNVPTVFELMDQYKVADAKRRLVNTYLGLWGFGSMPIVTTPGVPADRVKLLREAYCENLCRSGISGRRREEGLGAAPGEWRRTRCPRQRSRQSAAGSERSDQTDTQSMIDSKIIVKRSRHRECRRSG